GTNYLIGGGKQGLLYLLDRRNLGGYAANRWTWAFWQSVRQNPNATYADWPEDYSRDNVVQKIQAGFNQYISMVPPPTARSCRALWMNDWWPWPHIHGTPVFATFRSGRAMAYLWPEKDHLKAFRWLGNRFDDGNRVLAVDRGGALVLAPPCRHPPEDTFWGGMPGGMLSVSIDPNQSEGGVLFASVPRDEGDQSLGWLRAFDAVTLRELWNNDTD